MKFTAFPTRHLACHRAIRAIQQQPKAFQECCSSAVPCWSPSLLGWKATATAAAAAFGRVEQAELLLTRDLGSECINIGAARTRTMRRTRWDEDVRLMTHGISWVHGLIGASLQTEQRASLLVAPGLTTRNKKLVETRSY